ncbi:hypothetical protein DFJ73DRAFT_780270 [Zopfochytrium polystomum]|nr:hypothetical protein DFJ73DRAFT_780270 [Zopfochytrium polystomum]
MPIVDRSSSVDLFNDDGGDGDGNNNTTNNGGGGGSYCCCSSCPSSPAHGGVAASAEDVELQPQPPQVDDAPSETTTPSSNTVHPPPPPPPPSSSGHRTCHCCGCCSHHHHHHLSTACAAASSTTHLTATATTTAATTSTPSRTHAAKKQAWLIRRRRNVFLRVAAAPRSPPLPPASAPTPATIAAADTPRCIISHRNNYYDSLAPRSRRAATTSSAPSTAAAAAPAALGAAAAGGASASVTRADSDDEDGQDRDDEGGRSGSGSGGGGMGVLRYYLSAAGSAEADAADDGGDLERGAGRGGDGGASEAERVRRRRRRRHGLDGGVPDDSRGGVGDADSPNADRDPKADASRRPADAAAAGATKADADEMALKREFLIKLARAFAMYGAPTHRLEYHMSQVGKVLSIDSDFVVYPGVILASFTPHDGPSAASSTHILKTAQGFNMGKLAQVNALCLALTRDLVTVEDAVHVLDKVRAEKEPHWIALSCRSPLFAFTFAILTFSSSWLEAGVAALLGVVVGLTEVASARHPVFANLLEFVASLVCTLLARVAQTVFAHYGLCYSPTNAVLSAVSVLLPGLSLTVAVIELSTRNIISGTVRLFGAVFTATLIGFGMTLGNALALWPSAAAAGASETRACTAESPFWNFLLFWPLALAAILTFKAHPRQWAPMLLAAGAGWVAYELLGRVPQFRANAAASTAVCATVIGLAGNIYARVTHDVALAPILAGIYLQVPGSLGVRSSLTFFAQQQQQGGSNSSGVVDGIQFAFDMLAVGVSLAIGLFVASFVMWPVRGPKYKYLTI